MISHYIIIFTIMILVATTVIVSTCLLENNEKGKALPIGLSCALLVGITLLLFDLSLSSMATILS